MKPTWEDFFKHVDGLALGDPEREKLMSLLRRNFAAIGYPATWPDITDYSPEIQQRLSTEWTSWALRDVEWIAVKNRLEA